MAAWMIPAAILGSALFGSRSASKAADTQAAAADRAAELQNQQYQQTRQDQAPFREAGLTAQNRLMTLLGIGGQAPSTGGGGSNVAGMVANAVRDSGAVGSGLNIDPNSPDYGKYARDFGMADFQADPGYAFRLSEGQKQLDRQAAIRGGQISGSALKAAGRYGQDMASQEFTNAFNRYQINRSNQINPLQGFMTGGQSATNLVGQAGQNYATNAGNMITGGAAAQAAGQVGAANALTGGVGTYINYGQNQAQNSLLQQVLQNRGGGGYMTEPYPGYNASIGIKP
jgi:hypothetical protein